MKKYPMVLSVGEYFVIFQSRWTLFPMWVENEKFKEYDAR